MIAVEPFWRELRLFLIANLAGLGVMIATVVLMVLSGTLHRGQNPGTVASSVIGVVFYLSSAYVIIARLPVITERSIEQLGLRPLRRADWAIVALASAGVFVAKIVNSVVLEQLHRSNHQQAGFEDFAPHGWLAATAAVVLLVFIGPIAEELSFRFTLFRALRSRLPVWAAAVASSILFAALHGDVLLFGGLFVLGLAACYAFQKTQNILTSMLVHGINNAIATIGLLTIAAPKH